MIGGTPPKAMAPMASMASMGETTGATHRVKKSTGVELGQRATWSCGRSIDESGWTVAIPNCAQGTALAARIVFGQCASTGSPGLNETVFAVQGSCPSTHPFGVAQLRIRAEITARPTAFSSGPLTSLHADFLNAWDQTSLENLHTVCIRGQRDADQIKQCGLAGTGPRVTGFG